MAPGGWQLFRELDGCQMRVEPIEDGLRLTTTMPSGSPPAVWLVKE